MKSLPKILLFALAFVLVFSFVYAESTDNHPKKTVQVQINVMPQKSITISIGFIDEDGDGINDYARDDDGDGIPNGLDPDFVKPMDGTGKKFAYGRNGERGHRGIGNELCTDCNEFKHNWGGSNGTGVCDGNGPHGNPGRNRGNGKH